LAAATHTIADQAPFLFCNGTTDLKQQLVMGVLAHRPVQKLHWAAALFHFFQQEHLVHEITRQSVRSSRLLSAKWRELIAMDG
jgi:hypothetical protein